MLALTACAPPPAELSVARTDGGFVQAPLACVAVLEAGGVFTDLSAYGFLRSGLGRPLGDPAVFRVFHRGAGGYAGIDEQDGNCVMDIRPVPAELLAPAVDQILSALSAEGFALVERSFPDARTEVIALARGGAPYRMRVEYREYPGARFLEYPTGVVATLGRRP